MMKMRLSVIIPVYKAEKYLEQCVDSVLSQDFEQLEVILVAQDSGDRCVDICNAYSKTESRVRTVVKSADGAATARNAGMDIAKGEFITFVDADDYILPGMYSHMYQFSVDNGLDICTCSAYRNYDEHLLNEYWCHGREIVRKQSEGSRCDIMLTWNIIGRNGAVWNKLFKREFLDEHCLRFPANIISEDSMFNCACFSKAKAAGAIENAYYVYGCHQGSLLHSSDELKTEFYIKAYWDLLLGATKDDNKQEEILAYSAVRLIAASIYNLKLAGRSTRDICCCLYELIQKMKFEPYFHCAAEPNAFSRFSYIFGMQHSEAENYLHFIQSLCDGKESMIAWQDRYKNEFRQVK